MPRDDTENCLMPVGSSDDRKMTWAELHGRVALKISSNCGGLPIVSFHLPHISILGGHSQSRKVRGSSASFSISFVSSGSTTSLRDHAVSCDFLLREEPPQTSGRPVIFSFYLISIILQVTSHRPVRPPSLPPESALVASWSSILGDRRRRPVEIVDEYFTRGRAGSVASNSSR
ncbi:uncharacterized protein M421DRAFT_95210 [Didymella exigua CBS 183.55]|uniref:Uncharacterized protein n=1 Tax=Didymella exigua CBS 183.55 TaxID=1150837 RepID=A0A6A5RDK6_9PLEO|nr:uncharacterized protein M421DRAFT_95210 [Didymella exigua CBS 183.55]KAF1924656.1 hypothetical protein M421DRAFT_95210 [Didymella exigua CBS 183.55]